MNLLYVWIMKLCLLTIILLHLAAASVDYKIQRTISKNVTIIGRQIVQSNGIRVDTFLGIPYAKPPIGSYRFQQPQPLDLTSGTIIEALELPVACYQDGIYDTEKENPASKIWFSTKFSEDCLRLNVWSPTPSSVSWSRLPVLVWIYGGSFNSGSSSLTVYDGSILAAREQVIVVSMEYRVGVFGFFYTGSSAAPGNQGLWDQRMALQWVKENIEYFNGDPTKVTLFGESAGAACVGYHVISPQSQHLFQNAILMSSSPLGSWTWNTQEDALKKADLITASLNCTLASSDPIASVECLNKFNTAEIWSTIETIKADRIKKRETILKQNFPNKNKWNETNKFFSLELVPVIDDNFIPLQPADLLKTKSSSTTTKRTIVLGSVKNEATYFLFYGLNDILKFYSNNSAIFKLDDTISSKGSIDPYNLMIQNILDEKYMQNSMALAIASHYRIPNKLLFHYSNWTSEEALQQLDRLGSDVEFRCPTLEFAERMLLWNNKVFFYEFQHSTGGLTIPKWFGAPHGYEIDYAFGQPFNLNFTQQFYSYTDEERLLSEKMMQWIGNVAKYNDPNNPANRKTWPSFNLETRQYLQFNIPANNLKVGNNLCFNDCMFWRVVVPQLECVNHASAPNKLSTSSLSLAGKIIILLFGTMFHALVLHP